MQQNDASRSDACVVQFCYWHHQRASGKATMPITSEVWMVDETDESRLQVSISASCCFSALTLLINDRKDIHTAENLCHFS